MDKTCKKILQSLINGGKGTQYICAYEPIWLGMCNITIEDLAKGISVSTEDVRAATRFLVENGYLEYQKASEKKSDSIFRIKDFIGNTIAAKKF